VAAGAAVLAGAIAAACAFSPEDMFNELPSECYRRCNDALDVCIADATQCFFDCDQYGAALQDQCERACGTHVQSCFQGWGRCGEQCLRDAESALR
jgi:hypothetical protein